MKQKWILCGLLAAFAATSLAGTLDSGLENILAAKGDEDTVSTLVYVKNPVDLEALEMQLDAQRASLRARHETVVRTLQATRDITQANLRDHLKSLAIAGEIEHFESYWICNAFRVDAPASTIRALAEHPDVLRIYFNYPVELIEPTSSGKEPGGASPTDEPEPGLVAIRAPEVWALGYTGEGILVSTLDTGVDGNHPALASRWAGTLPEYAGHPEWAWRDSLGGYANFPGDSGTHGTHTMGTVCGGLPGDEIGVAPGAMWIADNSIGQSVTPEFYSDVISAYQWLTDPDGNPATVWDVPATNSNSWGVNEWWDVPPCDEFFWDAIDACEAAGIVMLFSAGNEGSSGLRRPADRATTPYNVVAVASVNANVGGWPISSFSSRGPTYCTPDGSVAIKPDIAAPGEDVRSAVPGGYDTKSGTSMASPHVNGVVALMRQACPDLTNDEIKQIIYETAVDLGPAGEDNDYGWGMIDAYECVLLALDMCGPSPPRVQDSYYETAVDTPVTATLLATDSDGGPNPIEWKIVSLPAQQIADAGNGYVILPSDLPYTLVNNGNEVVYTPSGGFYGEDTFQFQATDGGVPPEGGDSEVATVTILVQFDPPTIITETLPNGCLNRAYGPVQLEADQGQPELAWTLLTDEYVELNMGSNEFEAVGSDQNWNADDNSWQYGLPFNFPFFGDTYSNVWVCSNGYLDFASNSADYSNSTDELLDNVRIAPLWDDWETDCASSNDIYIDASVAGQVTIRWDVEHYPCAAEGDFSVTLFNDGTIQFHYGPSNMDLTPTIGISAGDGQHYLLATYDGAGSLNNADSLELIQPVPLPDGLNLSPDGEIYGTPTETGTFEPRVLVTDALGRQDTAQVSLTILEQCPFELGDMDCDGDVDFDDINPFVLALSGQNAYEATWPDCNWLNGDINNSGTVDFDDINSFVELLSR